MLKERSDIGGDLRLRERQLVDESQSVDGGRATHDLDDVNRAPGAEETRGYYPPPHGTFRRGGGIGCASLCY